MVTVDQVGVLLFGKTRRAVLALLFTRPTEAFYLRQIVRLAGAGIGPVQRELKALLTAGIVRQHRQGQHVMYQVNPQCPAYSELAGLVTKTLGVAETIRVALEPLADEIRMALIFGSFARGEQREQSDVDLFVVSDKVGLDAVVRALRDAQQKLGREINPVVYGSEEYERKLKAKHHFLTRILREPTIWLIGERIGT